MNIVKSFIRMFSNRLVELGWICRSRRKGRKERERSPGFEPSILRHYGI